MENANEIITGNDEVIEAAEEVIERGGMKLGFKLAIGAGITAIVGYAAYRFVVKPALAKSLAKKKSSLDDNGENSVAMEIEADAEVKTA